MENYIGGSTIVEIGKENYKTVITSGKHTIIADEPEDVGGKDQGINPQELLLASLGTCTAITLRMYADRKQFKVDKISIELRLEVVKSNLQQTTYIKSHIHIEGEILEEQRKRMLQIAQLCPVHKMLSSPVVISTNLV